MMPKKVKKVKMEVHEDFFNIFDKMRRKKQQELGVIKLGNINFSQMLVNSKSIKYPRPIRYVKRKNKR